MLENLSETSEVASKFFETPEAEESIDQPDVESEEPDTEDIQDVDESDDEDIEDSEDDEEEPESLTVFGEEITREDFETMKNQQLMHADYTKKTQELAEGRKQVEALNTDLTNSIAAIESLIAGEDDSEELAELLENDDAGEYLRREKLSKTRKAKVEAAKKAQNDAIKVMQAEEGKKLGDMMTEWQDPKTGQAKQKSDIDAALKYAESIGLDSDSLNKLADHRIIRALVDGGRLQALKQSKPGVTKRKTNASKKVTSKSTAKAQKPKSTAELFYGAK